MSLKHINSKKSRNITITNLNENNKFPFQLNRIFSINNLRRANTMQYIKKSFYNSNKNFSTKNNDGNNILFTHKSNKDSSLINQIILSKKQKKHFIINNEKPNDSLLDRYDNYFKKNDLNLKEIKLNKNEHNNKSNNIKKELYNSNNSENKKYYNCFLCERIYRKVELLFPECKIHPFCKNCLYLYFKNLSENKDLNLKCPEKDCYYNINLDILKNIIDEKNYNELYENKGYKNKKKKYLKKIINKESIVYNKNSILEINTVDSLIKSINDKKNYCPKCQMPIYETSNNYYKCLNCYYKKCKFCLKEYTITHLINNEKDYCKVYYRSPKPKINYIKIYFMQLIYVFAIYFLCIISTFILPLHFCKHKFKIDDKKIQSKCFYIKIFLSYALSIIIMIIIIPFIIILFPYFPYFIAFLDF